MLGSRIFLSGGAGVQAPQLILQFTEGGPMVLLHIFQGGGVQLFPGGGVQMLFSIETHLTITCDLPGGLDPLSPSGSANVQCGILARIGSDEPVRPPFKLRNSKC